MSVISNVLILQNTQAKKAFSKISFEVGETFNARIVSTDQQNGEVNLKLLDGWQFSAKLDKPLQQPTSGSALKFEVEGFEDDKLIIKLVNEDKEGKIVENDFSEDFTKGRSLSTEKTDALLFEKMIKHDMPLTKDNIIDIKNLVDFRDKISLDVDEILLFKENNIELTKGNLESFIKLFKGESAIYNNLKDINSYFYKNDTTENVLRNNEPTSISPNENSFIEINDSNVPVNLKNLQSKTENPNNHTYNKNVKEVVNLINKELKNLDISQRVLNSTIKNLTPDKNLKLEEDSFNSGTLKTLVDKIFKAEQISLNPDNYIKLIGNLEEKLNITQFEISAKPEPIKQNEEIPLKIPQKDMVNEVEQGSKNIINTKTHGYTKNNSINEIINMIKKELNISEVDRGIITNVEKDLEKVTTHFLIKEQIKLKTDEIKNIIKNVIENKLNIKPETYEKVINLFDQKLNDIKIFNSISE